ncbi:FHA domain-containing protein [Clostridium hydrogeniformans]|uniref:FHA domain-containing protein n=1 Tax=Clostridium hydrogeniformans TaxID=349933 RepID=UPI000488F5AF|nr:FHA domain-containing protein [Clostridium hydrogeniformans]
MNKILTFAFTAIFIVILYSIIIFSLKIMAKDVRNGGKKKRLKKASLGLEVISSGENNTLKVGAVVPINGEITLGRRDDNSIILNDQYVSGYHAKIYLRNNQCIIEDLNSTNGTFINEEDIKGKRYVEEGDKIKIGSVEFKIIG